MMANAPPKAASTVAREAFFLDFAKAIREKFRSVPLMVTGGFRTRQGMEAALREDACDIIGLGRPSVLNPHLPANTLFNAEVADADATVYARNVPGSWLFKKLGIKGIAGGAETVCWLLASRSRDSRIGQNTDYDMHSLGVVSKTDSQHAEQQLIVALREGYRGNRRGWMGLLQTCTHGGVLARVSYERSAKDGMAGAHINDHMHLDKYIKYINGIKGKALCWQGGVM